MTFICRVLVFSYAIFELQILIIIAFVTSAVVWWLPLLMAVNNNGDVFSKHVHVRYTFVCLSSVTFVHPT